VTWYLNKKLANSRPSELSCGYSLTIRLWMFIFLNNNLFGLNMANTCGSFLKNLSMTVIDLATFLEFYLYAIKTIVVLKKDSISF